MLAAEDFDNFYDMQMYMTAAMSMNDMKGLGLQMALDAMHKKNKKDVVTGLKEKLQPGRPDWNKVNGMYSKVPFFRLEHSSFVANFKNLILGCIMTTLEPKSTFLLSQLILRRPYRKGLFG